MAARIAGCGRDGFPPVFRLPRSAKGAKRYWHKRGIEPIKCVKFWLGATSFIDALREARDAVVEQGIVEMKIWADEDIGNIWISATAPQLHDGKFVRPCPF